MTRIKSTLATFLVAGSSSLFGGCDTASDGGTIGAKSLAPAGSYVHIQFRRDFLGMAGEGKVGLMGEAAAQPVASSGELKGVTDEFVVLQVDNEANRELWIPRAAVLLLDVRLKPPQ